MRAWAEVLSPAWEDRRRMGLTLALTKGGSMEEVALKDSDNGGPQRQTGGNSPAEGAEVKWKGNGDE